MRPQYFLIMSQQIVTANHTLLAVIRSRLEDHERRHLGWTERED
jgi:hypothetical protein